MTVGSILIRTAVMSLAIGVVLGLVPGGVWDAAQSKAPVELDDAAFVDMGVASSPYGVAVSSDGSRVYVAANLPMDGDRQVRSKVVIVDATTKAILKEVVVPFQAWEIAVTPDGNTVLVTTNKSGIVAIIDTRSGQVIAELDAGSAGASYGDSVFALALSPDGATAYVALRTTRKVAIIDIGSRTIAGSPIDVTGGNDRFLGMPYDIAVSPDGALLYVTNGYNKVTVIDAEARQVTHHIHIDDATDLRGLAVTPDGRKLYATDFEGQFIAVIDTATRGVTKKISSSISLADSAFGPQNVAFSPDGTTAYVAAYTSGDVIIIDALKDRVRRIVDMPRPSIDAVGHAAAGLAVSPDGETLYVTDYYDWLVILRPKWAPDSPRNVRAKAGPRQATITWTPPGDMGSGHVRYYTVTASRNGGTCVARGVLTCTIKGLRKHIPYRFTVTATNSAGTSYPSLPSSSLVLGS